MCNPSQGFYGSNNTFSPATQAVWDAAYNTPEDCPYEHDLAAALRAAVDQVVPEVTTPWNSTLTPEVSAVDVRAQFLAIAAELEAQ